MHLRRTEKAVAALASRDRTLHLKVRALLLLADGIKTDTELLAMVQAEPSAIAMLLDSGHLSRTAAADAARSPKPTDAGTTQPESGLAAAPSGFQESALNTQAIRVAADAFDGKRSLATARMFLFDLTERLFTRRDPALAQAVRQQLREARDRETMLAAARELLHHIELHAGASRADDVSARLAMLLPDDRADSLAEAASA